MKKMPDFQVLALLPPTFSPLLHHLLRHVWLFWAFFDSTLPNKAMSQTKHVFSFFLHLSQLDHVHAELPLYSNDEVDLDEEGLWVIW